MTTNKKTTSISKKTGSQKNSNQNLKWIILGSILAICAVSYFLVGLFLTVFLAIGIGIIVGIARLLDSVKSKKKQRRIVNGILITFLVIGIIGTICVGGFIFYVVQKAPSFDIARLEKKESSIMYDSNNNETVRLGSELRENVTYDDLPEVFIDALIATEDSRFFQHNGFDAPRFIMASLKQAAGSNSAGGASTLSMQVIKNSITSTEAKGFEGIVRKFTDIYLSIFKLEKNFTKEEIIEFYVNNHFLGNNSSGVEQAAKVYFGKSAKDLNLSEAAMIVGMFKAPSNYDPYKYPEKTYTRRLQVLNLMVKHGYITEAERDAANSISISDLVVSKDSKSLEFQAYIDTVIEELKTKRNISPYTTPLLIYTNMDRTRQAGMDKIFNGETFKWVNDVIQSGVAVTDINTGKIVAVGAGRNKTTERSFNFATQNTRQIGSTAKPIFDYGPGMEYNNWSTYTQFVDEEYTYSNGVSINNSDRKFMGQMSLRNALAHSRNIPALKAFQQVDNKKIIDFVQSLGITPEIENGKIHEAHSLGAFPGATPLEMAAAYAAFGNGGYYIEPLSVNKIVYRDNGDIVTYEAEKKQVMSDSTAFMMTDALQTAVTSGLSSGAKINGVNLAAKTGTTSYDDATKKRYDLPGDAVNDAWVVGYDPDYSVSMWYGYERIDKVYCNRTNVVNERSRLYKAIGNIIFNKDNKQFEVPNSVTKVGIENGSDPALLPSAGTSPDQITYEYFKKGTEPTETSTKNQKLETVKGLKVTYDEAKTKVNITWSKLNTPAGGKDYGEFGYNVYYGDTLLGFTTENSYSIDADTNIDGTYKVVTVFKNYTANQSLPAEFVFTRNNKPSPSPSDTFTAAIVGETNKVMGVGQVHTDPLNPINILKNGTIITEQIDLQNILTSIVLDPDGATVITKTGGSVSFTTSRPGVYKIKYTLTYGGHKYELTRKITVQ